jgi:putative peptide zinc metalloprotease protein
VLPLQVQIPTQGLLRPAHSYPIVAAVAGRIAVLPGTNGSAVPTGTPILTLEAPDLELKDIQTQQKVLFADWHVGAAGVDAQTMGRLPVLRQELATVTAEATGIVQEMAKLANAAPFDGVVIDLEPDLRTGDWLRRHERVGHLIQTDEWIVDAYLAEHTIERIRAGDSAKFFPETAGATAFDLIVDRIDRDASRSIPERILTAAHGGLLLAREKDGVLIPAQSLYKVTFRVTNIDKQSPPQGERRGLVVIYGRPATLLGDFVKTAGALLVRESGM